jgi:excisionase family DNA binding protein
MEREPFVDEATAAEYLAVSVRFLRDLRRAGKIPGYSLGCGRKCRLWRYRLSELESAVCHLPTTPAVAPDSRSKGKRRALAGAGR